MSEEKKQRLKESLNIIMNKVIFNGNCNFF